MVSGLNEPLVNENVVVLGGGTGTPKLLRGLIEVVNPKKLTIIVNTADDWIFYGLHVSPDVDSMLYVLSGLLDESKWWGIIGDTFNIVNLLRSRFGEDVWFNLGDQDLVTCLYRTHLLRQDFTLTQVTEIIARKLGIVPRILPMTEGRIQSIIVTEEHGPIHIEEYFVKYRCRPKVFDVVFDSVRGISASNEVLNSITEAKYIILGPSNPVTSIGPILHLRDIKNAIMENEDAIKLAISPVIGSKPVSGPTGSFLEAWKVPVTPVGIASLYVDVIDHFIVHVTDRDFDQQLRRLGVTPHYLDVLIPTREKARRLSREIFDHVR